MKKGWEIKKLVDIILDIKDGGTPSRTKPEYFGGKVSWCVVKDILPEIYQTKESLTELGLSKCSAKVWPVNSIIISLGATIGQVGIAKIPVATKQGISGIIVNKDILIPELLVYYLNFKKDFIQNIATGTTIKEVRPTKLATSLDFPLPPLSEQCDIVAFLDETFAALVKVKANAEQNLKNAKELFESYLQSVFENKIQGSKFETLDSLCELVVDCEHKTAPTQETGYPSIRTPNIGKGVLILEGVNRVSEKTYNEWTRRAIPQADDLILAREAPAGNIAVIPENIKVCLGQRTVLIRPKKNKLVSKFLAYLILSKDVQAQLLSHSTGATVEHINMKDIRAFKIFNLSSLSEQHAIVENLDSLSSETKKLKSIYQQKINDLEELKKSILQKAFSGELKEKLVGV